MTVPAKLSLIKYAFQLSSFITLLSSSCNTLFISFHYSFAIFLQYSIHLHSLLSCHLLAILYSFPFITLLPSSLITLLPSSCITYKSLSLITLYSWLLCSGLHINVQLSQQHSWRPDELNDSHLGTIAGQNNLNALLLSSACNLLKLELVRNAVPR